MDEYYQNSPLPTWVGWYVGHAPHWFHAATVIATLVLEFVLVFMLFFPQRVRLICFLIVTPWEIGVILTGNYAFLNYLVLSLGILLLDDSILDRLVPARFRVARPQVLATDEAVKMPEPHRRSESVEALHGMTVAFTAVMLTWIAYVTTVELLSMPLRRMWLPAAPVTALEPFRIANQYGLFAVMTRGRYEVEFQGSNDNESWKPYSFHNKPQALDERPRIYAPYQPRFDWNLWFASLGDWRQNQIVPLTQERLLENDADVLGLFRENPFSQAPPRYVRAVLWRYWFTSLEEKQRTGNWWRRQLLGAYSPTITRTADGKFGALEWPGELPPHD
jgi:hypothetical protein